MTEKPKSPEAEHEAADPFEKIRRRADRGPYVVDTCHGMVGGPAVCGPSGITGFMQGEDNQRKAEQLARDRNIIWACGYEAAVADLAADRAEAVRAERERARQREYTLLVAMDEIDEAWRNLSGQRELDAAIKKAALVRVALDAPERVRARAEESAHE
jgi:hypothetical protein